MTFFLARDFRVIAHDRRGHGRSTQVATGHDMDHYADDLAALTAHLNLKNAIHVGHSTGGGEVTRYIGRHGESRVAKAVLISSVPPNMVKTPANPTGLPKEVFDGLSSLRSSGARSLALSSSPGARGVGSRWRVSVLEPPRSVFNGMDDASRPPPFASLRVSASRESGQSWAIRLPQTALPSNKRMQSV